MFVISNTVTALIESIAIFVLKDSIMETNEKYTYKEKSMAETALRLTVNHSDAGALVGSHSF